MPKRKLLLADDSVTIQKVVNLTFTDEGFEVFTVGSGTAAMNMIGTVQPDLVLADVHMPGLTGYEVCEKIRQKPEFSTLPVILLVGSFEPFDEAEAERVGANDFLTKPFQSIRQLIEKVGSLLDAPKADGITATVSTATTGDANDAEEIADEEISAEAETAALATDDSDYAEVVDEDEIEIVEQTDGEDTFGGEIDDETIEIMSGDEIAANQSTESKQLIDQNSADDSFENRPTAPLSYSDAESASQSFASAQTPTETVDANFFETQTADFETNTAQPIFSESDDEPFGEMPASAVTLEDSSAQDFDTISTENADQAMSLRGAESIAATAPATDFSAFEIDFDDDSLLELDEEVEAPELPIAEVQADSHVEVMPPQNFAQDAGDALIRSEMSAPAMSNQNLTFSPEMIDQIAQRVVEKLSDKVIEKIAWEIVPDRFDLIVRKHIDGRER